VRNIVIPMLIPRDDTQCFEAVLETVAVGHAPPPTHDATFVQMYIRGCGRARIHIGEKSSEDHRSVCRLRAAKHKNMQSKHWRFQRLQYI